VEARKPPHSIEAEQAVLGGLMLDTSAWDNVADAVRAWDFYRSDHRLIFEAPQRHQQIWFIERYGKDVNLGNIDPHDVISLETLRVGLRADTLMLFHGDRA